MLDLIPDSKSATIQNAAIGVFLDYGFKRTTMDDIAQAAGMSRPALYLVYKNKRDIFRACITSMQDVLDQRLNRIIEAKEPLESIVYAVLEAGIIEPFYLLAQTTHGSEIFDTKSDLANDLFEIWMRSLETAITTILHRASAENRLDLGETDMEPEQIAALIVDGAEGIKLRMGDGDNIERKLKSLIGLILRPLAC